MTKITCIDRATHRLIGQRIETALKDLGDELGIDFTSAGGQYSSAGTGRFRIDASCRATASGASGAEDEFRRYAPMYGVDPDAFGKKIWIGRKRYTLTGVKPNARKNVFTVENELGETYVTDHHGVASQFPYKKTA